MGFEENYWNYLRNKTKYVEIDEILNKPIIFEFGVLRGTVLGPLLFNTYINDLLKSNSIGKVYNYADDTVIQKVAFIQ